MPRTFSAATGASRPSESAGRGAGPGPHRQPATSSGPERRRFLLVHNPTAGVRGGRLVSGVVAALEARGATVVAADREAQAARKEPLDTQGYDAVLAAGGDGTIRGLAAAAGEVPVGIVPAGTGNVFATEIGLPRTAEAVAGVLMTGPVIEVEGAHANGEPFFLMAGAGYDGDVIHALDLALKRRLGKLAYALPGLRAILSDAPELRVTVDGLERSARWVVVANARHYGGSFVIAPQADVLKPGLEAVLFTSRTRLALLRHLLALATGRLAHDVDVAILPCRRVTVDAEPPVRVQVDGDEFGSTPLMIEAGGSRLKLIVPPEFAARRVAGAAG